MRLAEAVVPICNYPVDNIRSAMPPASDAVWDTARFRKSRFKPHESTRSIVFSWLDNAWEPGRPFLALRAQHGRADLAAAVWDCADMLAERLGGSVAKLMLAELAPGAVVREHIDESDALTCAHRCHVPIVTNPDVDFFVDRKRFYLEPGIAYEFDNTRWHSVSNRSAIPRVHLICDIMPAELVR